MRIITAAIILILLNFKISAQIPPFIPNTTETDKSNSLAYKVLANEYDLVLSYSSGSYWSSNVKRYDFLARKADVWYKGSIVSTKNDSWSRPKLKIKKVVFKQASEIVAYLDSTGFFTLNRDSLNMRERTLKDGSTTLVTLSDGINCRFELMNGPEMQVIESYEPEYFLKRLPEFKQRGQFITGRNWFLERYSKL